MQQRATGRGFTMVEFTLVVAISGILIFGMATLIEVPRQMVFDQDNGQRVSVVDRTLSIMDRDIRFAKDVRRPDPTHLEVDLADGTTVVYSWEGAGSPLQRTSPDGSVDLIKRLQNLGFNLGMSTRQVVGDVEVGSDTTVVETASFNAFSLKSGYTLAVGRLLGGLISVSLVTQVFGISDLRYAGFYFQTQGISSDDASPVSFRARLRRYGRSDLQVRMYEATGSGAGAMPDRGKLVATAIVPGPSLPASFTDFTIPLTAVRKCRNDAWYFVELRSLNNRGNEFAAEVEVQSLSIPLAAEPANGGKLRSTDSGASYSPFTSLLSASQSKFSLQVMQSEPVEDPDGPGPVTTIEVATSVKLRATLLTQHGLEDLHASFPIQNKLALFNGATSPGAGD